MMTPEATTYLNEALDYIQTNSIMREQIDWLMLRQEVSMLVADAQRPSETYPAIERALELLGDHHSFFLDPAKVQLRLEEKAQQVGLHVLYPEGIIEIVSPGSPAQEAGLHVGDCIETVNGQPITALTFWQFRAALKGIQLDLTVRPARGGPIFVVHLHATSFPVNHLPQGRQLEPNIGYLDLPGFWGNLEQGKVYAEAAQHIIREIDQGGTCGWVIDLRCNIGGNMWPMLAGVGPVLGEGECTSFVAPWAKETVLYRNGQAISDLWGVLTKVDEPYHLKHSWPPVAVLTSQLTTSSGEFITMAFRGRPRTRSFGEPTCGVPTSNDDKKLSDGALVLLTTGLGADRTGQTYDCPLLPDHPIKTNWTQLGTVDDPVIQSALRWLQDEGGFP